MDPYQEYALRRDRWRAEHEILTRQFIRIGNWRLALAVLELILAGLVFGGHVITAWSLVLPVAAFVLLAVRHQHVIRRRTLAERAMRYYERGLGRLEGQWIGNGSAGEQFRDASHVYSEDIDVFGKGSLFELIATARTAAGEQLLADWLLSPATRDEAILRQQAVSELSTRLDLREDLALVGEDIRAEVDAAALAQWGARDAKPFHPVVRALAALLALAGVTTLLAFFGQVLPLWFFLAVLGCDFLLIWTLRKRVEAARSAADTPARGLRILSLVLARLERESFDALKLRHLHAALKTRAVPASRRIARLERWMNWFDSGDHMLVRVIRPVVLWQEQVTMGVEAWRQENGTQVGAWIRAIAEFEALCSLATVRFERPGWSFPEFSESSDPRFEAKGLEHPLLSPARSVSNDTALGGDIRLLIVSGSNMSGKSTLLRAVGLNCVLAWAGAPVAAASLRISALQPAASIRVVDSLQDNRSRFFAEISRIREIVELTKRSRPVLFLLDELLSGTNSHDRRIGAAGIVRQLVESGAIGLITTHDLALAHLEEDLGGRGVNVHFEDRVEDGQVEFDYRLRPGIVTHSNALQLMRAVGLEL